ncbi:restriction endonuclease subunit S [Vibrio parahaemolyticus]|uniref:restriction endonuclease subunit S n=1 Tax=Vibrio parahaemolyticus TaxID=670 RepID=UPI003390386A
MAGRYKAYPEYKASEVEWLENLPSSWQIMKVKFLLKDGSEGIKIGPFGSALKLEDMVESGIRVYGQENVIQKDFTLGKRFISQEKYSDMKVYTAEAGDILVTMMGTSGKCQVVPENADLGIIDSHLLKLRTNSKILPELFRLLVDETQEIKDQIGKQGKGSIMHGLNSSIVKGLELPLPSLEEQERILSFLDHETAKIDTLITKQEKLIELLKEKRQAVISHAVTKGLNPDAPMKDSGVEWLGEVPEHWAVAKLSYRYEVLLGKMLDEKKITGDFLGKYLRNTDVQWGTINTDNLPVMDFKPTEIERYSVKKGDLIVCEGGEIGRSAIWTSEVPCFYQKALHRLRPYDTKQDCSNFMYYVMFDAVHQERFSSGANKATIAHLPAETFRQYRFAYPPHTEQMAIAKYLEEIEHKFDSLQLAAKAQVELLTERKTALISAAVTGKIDVRHFVAEQGQPQGVQG